MNIKYKRLTPFPLGSESKNHIRIAAIKEEEKKTEQEMNSRWSCSYGRDLRLF